MLKNLTLEKLSHLTGIAEHHLTAIEAMDFSRLPAAPYVRGYLKKIAVTLGMNHEELWKMYERELTYKRSGAFDRLPTNRFKIEPLKKGYVVGGIIIAIVMGYLGFAARVFFTAPKLDIDEPQALTSLSPNSAMTLAGTIDPKDKLTINGEETLSDAAGHFEKTYNLQPGLNTIEFKVQRFLGKQKVEIRQVLYQPSANDLNPVPPTEAP